jgi:phenylacetate-CoA ligase
MYKWRQDMDLYQLFYENCWFPFFEGIIKGRETARIYKSLHITESLRHDELKDLQLSALKKLMLHANQHSVFHHTRFKDAGIKPEAIRSLDDLLLLPTMTKSDIRNNYDQIANNSKEALWTKTTGGSTGEPLRFAYTKSSYAWRVALSKRGYAWAGAKPGTKQALIWGAPLEKLSQFQQRKQDLHHLLDRQDFFNCYYFDNTSMHICMDALNKAKPEIIIGYTNPLFDFANFIRSNGGLTFQPKSIICAAEKLHQFQRDRMKEVFGCDVFNTYGSREFMLIASECSKHDGLHVSMENLIVEIIKDDGTRAKDGEIGRIIVTDLHNYGMPFIRYEIGDLGVASHKQCPCGRGLSLINDIVGRSLDMIEVSGGKMLPGEFFVHLMLDYPDILKFQAYQSETKDITLKLVPSSVFDKDQIDTILKKIREVSGPEINVTCEIATDIPLTKSGKYRVAVSMAQHSHD